LKRFVLIALVIVAVGVAFSSTGHRVTALQSVKAYKEMVIDITVTPSPVAYVPGARPMFRAVAQDGRVQVADAATYDVPMAIIPPPEVIAQATPQGAVPVKFNAIPDPTAQYLHLTPNVTATSVPYGTSTWTCAFQIYAYYTTAWKVTDWGYGTANGQSGTFPILNYPTTSDLAWNITTPTSAYMAYSNDGSPGQTTFSGTAGVSQMQCVNLQFTVPSTIAAGEYQATIQYNLYAN